MSMIFYSFFKLSERVTHRFRSPLFTLEINRMLSRKDTLNSAKKKKVTKVQNENKKSRKPVKIKRAKSRK